MTLHCRKKLFLATFSSFVLLHPAIAQNTSPTATEENSSNPINNKTTNTQQNTNSDKTQQKNEKTPDTAKNTKAAPDNGSGSASGAYELGKVIVFANNREWGQTAGETISQSTVSSEDIRVYNRNSLDDALKIVPGVTIQNTGAMRNEQKYYIRGFDMDQASLLIDGIQVYLPYDNGLDTGRFLTPDLAEIQVQKG
ncbi:TonB-dependent receptor plug domain-containing protein [Bartonella apihabitans]|uniref:TonB-dependent receptor plug domain-containing protein n=1 Tax=uncultured Bartonella sp. TaxID=104108 RepID=UPI0025FF3DBA|nr:TonB-dependent receptor plug domain-containing protein [Bartonella apihabitans]WLT08063.1 TonB-dependent receptor plug domain-containing protein [Bartonella apihabitans]